MHLKTHVIMARIIYNAVVSSINGSVSGTTFQKNAYGFTMRKKPQPVNPKSVLQSNRRTVFADITKTWNLLTDAQRANWNAVLTNYPTYARYAPSVIINGRMLFIKYNAIRMSAGYDMLIDFTISTPPIYQQNLSLINENNDLQAVWASEWESKNIGVSLQLSSNQGSQPWKKPTVYRQMQLTKVDSTHYSVSDQYINAYGKLAVTNDWVGLKSCMFSLTQPYFYAYLENFVQVGGQIVVRSTFDLEELTVPASLTGDVKVCYNFGNQFVFTSGANKVAYTYDYGNEQFSDPIPSLSSMTFASIGVDTNGNIFASFVEDRGIYKYNSNTSTWDLVFNPPTFIVWGYMQCLYNGTILVHSSLQNKTVFSSDNGATWIYFSFESNTGLTMDYFGQGFSSKFCFVASDGNIYLGDTNTDSWDNYGKPSGSDSVEAVFATYIGNFICSTYPGNAIYQFNQGTSTWDLMKDLELSDHIFMLTTSDNIKAVASGNALGVMQGVDSNDELTELTDLLPANTAYPYIYTVSSDVLLLITRNNLKLLRATLQLA